MPMIRASLNPMASSFRPCSETSGCTSLLPPALSTSAPFPTGLQPPSCTLHEGSFPQPEPDGGLSVNLLQRFREDCRVPIHLRLRGSRGHEGHVMERRDEHPAVERVQVHEVLEFLVV